MNTFEPVIGNVKLLKVPFGKDWTGVVLIDGEQKILIDSGARDQDIDEVLLPALKQEGYALEDIAYLVNTHSHGDHIGGHARLTALCPAIEVAAAETDKENVEDPAALAIATRGKYPAVSPAPQSYLCGVKVHHSLKEGDILADTLQLIETPGHDPGCVCWYHLPTGTLITGDSLQGNGTPAQGIGFYKSLAAYRSSLQKLLRMDIENILCGHCYDGLGYFVQGASNVKAALEYCLSVTEFYQKYIDKQRAAGVTDPAKIAEKLIKAHGCGMPDYLFMAVYTVCEHLGGIK